MKTILILLSALVSLIILYFLFVKKKDPLPVNGKKHKVPSRRLEVPPSTYTSTKPSNIPAMSLDTITQLKAHVFEGINNILSDYRSEDTKNTLPLQHKETNPEIIAKVKAHVGDMKEFSSFDELSALLDDPNVDMTKIAKRISSDPVLSNKILRVANSAYFGSRVEVDSINHALSMLGLINIKAILFHNAFSNKLKGSKENFTIYQSLWGHAIATATCAFYLSEAFDGLNKGKLYTLGLVHDIGKFIIPEMDGSRHVNDCYVTPFGEKTSIVREDTSFGINHAVAGRIAFEDSGLSQQLLQLIEYHHFPSYGSNSFYASTTEDRRYIAALYLANQIAKLFAGDEEKPFFAIQPLPPILGNLVNRTMLENVFSDSRVLSEILKTKSLTESYV